LSEPNPENDDNAKPTAVGCVVTLLTFAIIFGVALPIVRWRDPLTGQALPREIAIFSPLLIGGAFFGIASWFLRLIGLPVWSKQEKDESNRPQE
jgi:hypothetical protein